jgi:hypothetical protein
MKKRAVIVLVAAAALSLLIQPDMAKAWSFQESWSAASGSANTAKVTGIVEDRKADGLCVQILVKWYDRGQLIDTDYSPQACPKGNSDRFTMTPGDGKPKKADDFILTMHQLPASR